MERDHDESFQQWWRKYMELEEERKRLRFGPPSLIYGVTADTNDKPPADFSAHGKEGAKVKRAAVQQRMTVTERKAYRSGYQAGNKQQERFLEACQRVLQSLLREG